MGQVVRKLMFTMSPISAKESLILKKMAFLLAAFYLCFVIHRLYMGLQLTFLNTLDPNLAGSLDPVEMAVRNVVHSFLRPDLMYHDSRNFIWHQGQMLALLISLHGVASMLWVCGTRITKWIPWITGTIALVWLLIYLQVVGLVPSQYFIRPLLLLLMSGFGLFLGYLWKTWFSPSSMSTKQVSFHA
jgi:hypothetical protein